MGGGCSSNRAVHVTDKDSRIELKKKAVGQGDTLEREVGYNTLTKQEQDQIKKVMKRTGDANDLEESVEDLDIIAKKAKSSSGTGSNQSIWQAIDSGDQKTVEKLLNDIELQNEDLYDSVGMSMLHKAASGGFVEILMVNYCVQRFKLLIERTGAKPDTVNANLATPLHLACRNNHEAVVKFLVSTGCDVNLQDEHGQTPLLVCCIHGHQNLALLVIEASNAGHTPDPLDVDCRDHRGLTPLNCCAIKGDLNFSRLLVERGGANIEEASPKGCTPLLYAGRGGFPQLVKYFISQGANTMKQDNAGGTVVHHAIEKGKEDIMQILIENAVDINIADNAGRTPLFEAVDQNHENIVSLLIKHGANVDITNYSGHTSLFCACREGNLRIVIVLVEEGKAKIDKHGDSSVKTNDLDEDISDDTEKCLFEGLKCSKAPIHVASLLGFEDIVRYLIEKGGNPNTIGEGGYNTLHFAILGKRVEIAQFLVLDTVVDPFHANSKGITCKDLAQDKLSEYKDQFDKLLEAYQPGSGESIGNMIGNTEQPVMATHYYNPDDERAIKGTENDEIYKTGQNAGILPPSSSDEIDLNLIAPADIKLENGKASSSIIKKVFGENVALGIICTNWKLKEQGLQIILRKLPGLLSESEQADLTDVIRASTEAVSETCSDKVIKVFTVSIQIFQHLIGSSVLEQNGIETFVRLVTDNEIISKLLLKSEEGNSRALAKVHESVLDFSFHPQIGEGFASSFLVGRINNHNKSSQRGSITGPSGENEPTTFKPPISGQNIKGLLAQLQLLYKFITSFDLAKSGPLSIQSLKVVVLPNLSHQNNDIRQGAAKILIEIHKKSGVVNDDFLKELPQNTKQAILSKLETVQVQVAAPSASSLGLQNDDDMPDPSKVNERVNFDKDKNKEWHDREFTLKKMKDEILQNPQSVLLDQSFVSNCIQMMRECLDENNITLHLTSIDTANVFFQKALLFNYDAVIEGASQMVKGLALKTAHSNTRVSKKSEECILFLWDGAFNHINPKYIGFVQNTDTSVSAKITEIITHASFGEKAIAGRLQLLVKRIQKLVEPTPGEKAKSLTTPHQVLMGKNYIDITQFACQWCIHKNTKVRQTALKLIVEICRLNSIDQHGTSYQQKIIQFILGLRPSVRDPLINKINTNVQNTTGSAYIKVEELDGFDGNRGRHMSQERIQQKRSFSQGATGEILPQIQKQQNNQSDQNNPIIVLPHAEPLQDEAKTRLNSLINLFGIELITCFNSQAWANRQTAIDKVKEQINNLDPEKRDAMKTEINKQNYSLEESFPIFVEFIQKSAQDPVLKIYLSTLELVQMALPIYFRGLQQTTIQRGIHPLVETFLRKTSDLKVKIRDASVNMCLHLTHQSSIGADMILKIALIELEKMFYQQESSSPTKKTSQREDIANNMGNSNMWASCMNLLTQIQKQTKIAAKINAEPTLSFINCINSSLKHHTPSVRKSGEELFIVLYEQFGSQLDESLDGQKSTVSKKLLETAQKKTGQVNKGQEQKENVAKATNAIKENFMPQSLNLLFGQEILAMLRAPDPKKKQKALVEIKKIFSKQTVQLNEKKALELGEPITFLMRQILSDENSEIYLESLKLLKFFISTLAPHLGTLDLHMLIGSFVGIIVSNTVSSNMRVQMASDKVILYFAKHNNIGPFVVGKDLLKNIERLSQSLNKFTNSAAFNSTPRGTVLTDKKPIMMRFLNILQLLVSQFSIVLCYQTEFMDKQTEVMADLFMIGNDEATIKRVAIQLLQQLYSIDAKVLDGSISKLDMTKKTILRKAIIELENLNKEGKNVIQQPHQFSSMTHGTPPMKLSPGRNSSSRTTLFSPGTNPAQSRQISRDVTSTVGDPMKSTDGFKAGRGARRMINHQDLVNQSPAQTGTGFNPGGQAPSQEGEMTISQARRAQSLRRSVNQDQENRGDNNDPRKSGQSRLPPITQNSGIASMGGIGQSANYSKGFGTYQPSAAGIPPSGMQGQAFSPHTSTGFQGKSQRIPGGAQADFKPPLPGKRIAETQRPGFEEQQFRQSDYNRKFGASSGTTGDFNQMGASGEMRSSFQNPGMQSYGGNIPAAATFEVGTGGYVNRKAQNVERDILDEEIKRYNY